VIDDAAPNGAAFRLLQSFRQLGARRQYTPTVLDEHSSVACGRPRSAGPAPSATRGRAAGIDSAADGDLQADEEPRP
jgi:hypothetical protein